jgi:hypothetical protein
VARDERHVWFTPKSRHRQSVPACPKSAKTGLMHCNKQSLFDHLVGERK